MAARGQRRRSEWIQVAATQEDKELVQRIARMADDGFISRTVIRLIRQEGQRMGLFVDQPASLPMAQHPEPEAEVA